jgi:two-component system, OmpR family, response regulator
VTGLQDKAKILIVDDDEAVVKMLNIRLDTEGHEVKTAVDGFVAIKLAEEWRPDLILLDIAMPYFTGIDVVERLKRSETCGEIPVIIITAYPQKIRLVQGYSNVKACFIKPFEFPKLLTRIDDVLSGTPD